jgi:hypothetical protein
MMRMQLTWVCDWDGDGDGDEGEVVDCVAVGGDCALEVDVDGLVDCSAWAEVADWSCVVDTLVGGQEVDELGDAEVAEGFERAADLVSPPAGVGTPVSEFVPVPCGVDLDTVAMAPTGASLSPVVGRLPRTSRPTMMIPAMPPVTVTPSPRPRRFRGRRSSRSSRPFGGSVADLPARTGSRSPGLSSLRGAGRGAARGLSAASAL